MNTSDNDDLPIPVLLSTIDEGDEEAELETVDVPLQLLFDAVNLARICYYMATTSKFPTEHAEEYREIVLRLMAVEFGEEVQIH
jgi:hypothetical protein